MRYGSHHLITGLMTLLLAACVWAAVTLPAPPTNLRPWVVSNGLSLAWSHPEQGKEALTGYEIVRAGLFNGPFDSIDKVAARQLEYTDITADPEIIYYYKVRSLAGDRSSDFSAVVAGERPAPPEP